MNSSNPNPKLPTWLFIVTDLAFIGAAGFIAWQSRAALSNGAILAIVGCIGFGAVCGLIPLVARFERQKNEALDDRQRALEALARTVSSSAEQISIAANGLHEIAELAQKNLRHAEQLPHKLQDKMAEFQAQLAVAEDAEKEELERELLSLRTSESERLEGISQRIAKTTAEWVKLESATQQHLAAASDALARLATGTTAALAKSQAAADQALGHARIEATRAIGEASGHAAQAIEKARHAALADVDARLAAGGTALIERVNREIAEQVTRAARTLQERIAEFEAIARRLEARPVPPPETAPAPAAAAPHPEPASPPADPAEPTAPAAAAPEPVVAEPAKPEALAAPPKRARKVRREEPVAPESAASPEPAAEASPAPEAAPVPAMPPIGEPPPVPAAAIPEVAPVAPDSAEPFTGDIVPARPASPSAPTLDDAVPKAPRRRAPARRPEPDNEPGLGLDLDDLSAPAAGGPAERVMSSDGATRLLVTAYIGIGNRLFIRGDGPGLSWEKGVPLQFVSIGKWRWETNDATAPVQFKLFKNDDQECAALGAQAVDPGQQQELTAAF